MSSWGNTRCVYSYTTPRPPTPFSGQCMKVWKQRCKIWITAFKWTVVMLNIKDLFIKSVVLSIKVLFTESDSNAVQEAKGLVRATDIVHCSFGAQVLPFSQLWGCCLHWGLDYLKGFSFLVEHTLPYKYCSPEAFSASRCQPGPCALAGMWFLLHFPCCRSGCASELQTDYHFYCVLAAPLNSKE